MDKKDSVGWLSDVLTGRDGPEEPAEKEGLLASLWTKVWEVWATYGPERANLTSATRLPDPYSRDQARKCRRFFEEAFAPELAS
jgi:hypothetical protein